MTPSSFVPLRRKKNPSVPQLVGPPILSPPRRSVAGLDCRLQDDMGILSTVLIYNKSRSLYNNALVVGPD